MLTLHLLVVGVVGLLLWKLYNQVVSRRIPVTLKKLPGPHGYPGIGSILEFPKTFGYHKFTEWANQYGPIFQVNLLGAEHIVISDAEIANDLLALRGAHYSDRPRNVMLHELITHNGNLGTTPLSNYWRNARKLAAATLSSTALEVWNTVQVDEAVRLVRDLLDEPARYAYLFERYSSLVMLRILYGKKVTDAEEMKHVRTITNIVHTLERTAAPGAYLVDFLPALKYLPDVLAPFKKEARRLHEYEYSYFRGLVAEAEKKYDKAQMASVDSGEEPKDLVRAFLENKESWDLSDFELAYCLGTLFEGGSGTTSSAMQTFCLAMWHHPEWQKRIQREIDEVVGDRLPCMADVPDLPTVRAAIKETLRWRPVVPAGIPHVAAQDDSYNGFFIPKGAIIHANQFAMVQNAELYPDPGAYNPDRWLDPKFPTYQGPLSQYPNLKRFTAFGFGRRICPGLVSAERSLFVETTMLMWACSVEKKLDAAGNVIPVHWYDYTAGNNTCPKLFEFELKSRNEQRIRLLRSQFPGTST